MLTTRALVTLASPPTVAACLLLALPSCFGFQTASSPLPTLRSRSALGVATSPVALVNGTSAVVASGLDVIHGAAADIGAADGWATSRSQVGRRIDPTDWSAYRAEMHRLLDSCVDRMESYRDLPWVPPPSDLGERVALDTDGLGRLDDDGDDDGPSVGGGGGKGMPLSSVMESMLADVVPYAASNTHPKFFGWVNGAGMASSVAADLVASTMNSNCGARNHGAARVEEATIDFLTRAAGFGPAAAVVAEGGGGEEEEGPFGVLTGGTSQATIYALMAARTRKFGYGVRKSGILGLGPVRVYVSGDAHSCMIRAMECIGHGSDSVAKVPNTEIGEMDVDALRTLIEEDVREGITPMAIVATAGSVTVGAYDDFAAASALAKEHGAWLHVDAAFGFWTRLSGDPAVRGLSENIDLADSIALDAHKWPGVNYDCGALLVRDKAHLRNTMMTRPAYLLSSSEGLAGGDLWFTDYSLDLSRGFRALKLWAAIKTSGSDAIGQVITDNCRLASYMAALVDKSPFLEMAHRPLSNVACFSIKGAGGITAADIAADLQLNGNGVFSTIDLNGVDCLRAAIVNHRTTEEDIMACVSSVEEAVIRSM